MILEDFFKAPARHQTLYDTIAQSHPSLLAGVVWCGRCSKSRQVDAARCLREGWPKCCSDTMGLAPVEAKP
jgi:hypothetical protein